MLSFRHFIKNIINANNNIFLIVLELNFILQK